eukprot:GHVU01207302.1.p2 GENE.GHVU01207302.1~~GHVU01207302.1.p2  ORF type:complete len:102 (+),score=4.64 GHVU01207302.1:156-461(+)
MTIAVIMTADTPTKITMLAQGTSHNQHTIIQDTAQLFMRIKHRAMVSTKTRTQERETTTAQVGGRALGKERNRGQHFLVPIESCVTSSGSFLMYGVIAVPD